MSKRVPIKNAIIQGTVSGSLLCTTSMDKLGQHVYKHEELLYKYKGEVNIHSLGMVEDVIEIQKCFSDSMRINAVVIAFVEDNRITLSKKQCHKIHMQIR